MTTIDEVKMAWALRQIADGPDSVVPSWRIAAWGLGEWESRALDRRYEKARERREEMQA